MAETPSRAIRGRGTAENPQNRFERIAVEPDPEQAPGDRPETHFLRDATRSILSTNRSPDIPFETSLNPYRGCEHGCSYCYARPFHEYLGFSAGLDFETRIVVKEEAPALLAHALEAPHWRPQTVVLSGVTDPYQPVERRLRLTRGCLEVLRRFRNPVGIITKNHLVTRDADLLAKLAAHDAASASLSITTLDVDLARRLEPRASHPARRLEAIRTLTAAGVPAGVLVAPVIPGLTDHEIPAILSAAAEAGARWAGYVILRLPHGVADLFTTWLEHHAPQRKEKVLSRLRDLRGGALYRPGFGQRMRGKGAFAEQIADLFTLACRRAGLARSIPPLSAAAFERPGEQLGLFG